MKISFSKRDILDPYGEKNLGYGIYREDTDFKIPKEFLKDPESYLKTRTEELRVRTIYDTDRSTIFKVKIGNRSLFIKRMNTPSSLDMYHDIERSLRSDSVITRGENEIYSSSRAFNECEVKTSAEVILSGIKHYSYDGFYILMTRYLPGIFMDDFLLSREHLEDGLDEMKERVLIPLAFTINKIHGCKVEKGMVHNDLHPGNVYLRRPKTKKSPYGIIILDWENCDHTQPLRQLNESTRKRELQRFIEAKEMGRCKASLSDEEFDFLQENYFKFVNQEI